MMRTIGIAIVVAGLLAMLISACSWTSVSTSKLPIRKHRTAGMLYYLPKGKILITGSSGAGAASPGKTGSQGAATPTPSASPAQLANSAFTITINQDLEPDETAYFYLKQRRNYAFDDKNAMTVNSKFLLTGGNVTAQDQTPQIVATTASIVAQGLGFPSGGMAPAAQIAKAIPEGTRTMPVAQFIKILRLYPPDSKLPTRVLTKTIIIDGISSWPPMPDDVRKKLEGSLEGKSIALATIVEFLNLYPDNTEIAVDSVKTVLTELQRVAAAPAVNKQPEPFTVLFDPDTDEYGEAIKVMGAAGFKMRVTAQPQRQLTPNDSDSYNGEERPGNFFNSETVHEINGIVFRPPKVYTIDITAASGYNAHVVLHQSIALPDVKSALVLDYSRMPFVERTTNIGFTDGMLTSYSQSTPSPVLGFLSIPKAIIEAVVPLPTGSSQKSPESGQPKSASGSSKTL
jgi:hypothetical protein